MPLTGEHQPGTSSWSRKHVEEYEATNGKKAGDMRGMPVVVLTTVGAKTGKLRKTALMRVEHDGAYAVVASLGGAAHNPKWYYNLKANPHVELQDLAVKRDYLAHEATGDEKAVWWDAQWLPSPTTRATRRRRSDRFRSSCSNRWSRTRLVHATFTFGPQLTASLTLIGSIQGSTE